MSHQQRVKKLKQTFQHLYLLTEVFGSDIDSLNKVRDKKKTISVLSGGSSCIHNTGYKIAQEQRENETEMDLQPKKEEEEGGSLDENRKDLSKKTGVRPQQKIRNTLDQWLVKPSKNPNTTQECPSWKDVGVTDDLGSQSSSASSLNCIKSPATDVDEETQLLTPQDFTQSPTSKDSTGSGFTRSALQDENEQQTTEGSAKKRSKITDFFSGGLSVKKGRPGPSSEEGVGDKRTTPADVEWLGTPVGELKRMPECGGTLLPLRDEPGQHTVLIRVRQLSFFSKKHKFQQHVGASYA